ncbi:MAG TPA: magnesium transporter [Alphaproteobacteria bacterium]
MSAPHETSPVRDAAEHAVLKDVDAVQIELPLDLDDETDDLLYGMSDAAYEEVIDAVDNEDDAALDEAIADLDPADIATILEKAPKEKALDFLQRMRGQLDAEVYTYLGHQRLKLLFGALNNREIAAIIADLETDDAIGLLEDFDADERKDILHYVDQQIRVLVEEGLTYPEESAGRMMQRDYVAVPNFWTLGKTLDYLQVMRDTLPEQLYDVFVVDPRHRVLGTVQVGQLLRASRSQKMMEIATEAYTVDAQTDREDVATLFKRTILTSVPVIDEAERLIGVITIDDVVTVIDEEASEDLLRLAGVKEDDFYAAVLSTAGARFSWLLLNLFTAVIASIAIGFFATTLEKVVALAILMPIVASMGGNAGTQTLTVAVRALATKELTGANAWRVVLKESTIGLLNGIGFAILIGLGVWGWFDDTQLATVIAMAMIINLIAAGLAGALIPLGLSRLKFDPALGSSVFLTTVTDVIGFVAFLGLATWLMQI